MAIQFPTALDDFTNPIGTDGLGSGPVTHSQQHGNLNDAVEALEAKVGIDGSTDPNSLTYQTANAIHENGIIIGKASGIGIKVDTSTPTFGWRDLIGDITPKTSGVGSPTLDTITGNIRGFRYSVGDDGDAIFHIPHDYVPGSDLYIHPHWTHNGTNISGSLVITIYASYAKGHQQASFSSQITTTITDAGLTIGNTPALWHRIPEIQLSTAGGSASMLNTSNIEVDGLILVHYDVGTIPTITGGSAEPFILTFDLHYQSTGVPTKNKAPNFYA
jgi:hypothetical protein